jgi:spore coat protein CotH
MKNRLHLLTLIPTLALTTLGCRGDLGEEEIDRPPGYSKASHSNDAEPDYDFVFDTQKVHRIDIAIDAETFNEMREDLSISIYTDATPLTVDATINFDERVWEHVGMRFKALAAAEKAIENGSEKFSFKLKFDTFEDEHEETKNQRFYGFKRLNFSANHKDDSYLHEILASEIFRDGGVPTARATFYRVHVDVGAGPQYWGLYTMLEDPDDKPMIIEHFGEADGNLYQPEGEGADFTTFVEASFKKENNQTVADYSDVEAAIDALHDTELSASAWRDNFEATFNVDGFLDFLALNTAIVNGDAYGCLAENYYLYGAPAENGQLTFIPTDFNEAFVGASVSCGSTSSVAPEDTAADLFHPHIGADMPLISLLLADDTYRARYEEHLQAALEGAFAIETFSDRVKELHELITPHVVGDDGETPSYTSLSSQSAFLASVEEGVGLLAHVEARHELVAEALEGAQ